MRLLLQLGNLPFVAAFALALSLSACGGGGGGGSSPPPPPAGFSVAIDRTELRFNGEEGTTLAPLAVLGSGAGTPPSAIYLGSLDLATALDHVIVEVIGTQVKFTVFPKSNLPAGEHRGSLQLFACPDDKCAVHFSGSPVTVPYTITIAKGFKVSPAPLQLSALSGATASADVTVQLPAGQSSFTATSSSPWLAIANLGPTGFTVTAQPMPPGNYSATVSVKLPGRNKDISVMFVVTGDSTTVTRIIPDPVSLSFNATTTLSASRVLNVTLPSWTNELNATITYRPGASDWLGAVKSGERSLLVTASANTLAPGTYQAELVLRSGQATMPVTVPVTFTVGAASWSVAGATNFAVSGDTVAAGLSRDLVIGLPNLPAQAYTASTVSRWLKLSPGSGTTGGAPLRATVDAAELLQLPNFKSYTAEITLTAADARIAPTKVAVTLNKALPELHFVSPYTRLPGEGGAYVLRGRGLDSIVDLQQVLQVGGAVPTRVTRINDTEATVQLSGAASGDVSFALRNGLGAATGTPLLRTLAQGAFAYAALPTAGAKGAIVFDAERQAIYSANKALHSIMRFAYNGSAWDVTSTPLPGIDAVALSPDGKSLVATAAPGSVVLFDPATMDKQATYVTSAIGADGLNALPRLAVTNDGKAYFQGATWGRLSHFDLTTREFASYSGTQRFDFYHGPWFSVSGDGSRLNIVQSGSISSSPKMLYLNSSDGVVKENPAGLTFWYEASQSLRGERFVEGTYKVWDRDFSFIGDLVLPDSGYFARTPVVSPDGTRVYLLAYGSSFTSGTGGPRVFVFDSSTRMVTSTSLPLLGYFDIADYPTCRSAEYGCDTRALGTISPDGKTLFFIGSSNLVVAPIPVLTTPVQRAPMQRAKAGAGVTPKLERVRTRP